MLENHRRFGLWLWKSSIPRAVLGEEIRRPCCAREEEGARAGGEGGRVGEEGAAMMEMERTAVAARGERAGAGNIVTVGGGRER